MEKAVLKTLIYANIFDYPLKGYEILKWLVGKETTLTGVEKALRKLLKQKKIGSLKDYYFLSRQKNIVNKRVACEKYSKSLIKKAVFFAYFLKIIPWIKLIGISGGLALNDADKKDDIDLFIITSKRRIWISRLCTIMVLNIFGVRRKAGMKAVETKGKICLNTILDEDYLEMEFKDLYVAHEVLQMKALWQREGIYSKFLTDNAWVFKFLPNWIGCARGPILSSLRRRGSNSEREMTNWIPAFAGMTMEKMAKWFQLRIMKKAKGMERIEDGALYFYPEDYREKILKLYKQSIKQLH